MDPLKLGEMRERGLTTCAYGLVDPECDKPATYHFLWIEQSGTSPACDEHRTFIEEQRDTSASPYDVHVFGEHCGEPDAIWVVPGITEVSLCLPPSKTQGFVWKK